MNVYFPVVYHPRSITDSLHVELIIAPFKKKRELPIQKDITLYWSAQILCAHLLLLVKCKVLSQISSYNLYEDIVNFFFSYIHELTQMTCALFQQMHCTNQCISMRWYAIPIWQLDVYSGKKSHFIFFMFVLHFLIFPFQWLYHCFCAVYMLFKFSTLLLELKLKESRLVPFPNILTLDQLGAHCSTFIGYMT